jgi:MoxR-like ATPase
MSRLVEVTRAVESVILGKPVQIRLALSCLLARGHLLIEDVPGVGKTTLAHTLARVLGLDWKRVQFTSDLLPGDVTGVAIFDRATQAFQFRRGPVFTQLLLADEINRASPKAQSALLEAMEERQVTVDGETHALPEPFFVVATQNPHEQIGTYGLPESQLDRFLMRVNLGYPDGTAERKLLLAGERHEVLEAAAKVLTPEELLAAQRAVRAIYVAAPMLDYVQALVARTRSEFAVGLSPRSAQGLVRATQAWALLAERAVMPEHVQAVLPAVAAHRLEQRQGQESSNGLQRVAELIAAVPVPV